MNSLQVFDGETIDDKRDTSRLQIQLAKVRSFMWDGRWHTIPEVAEATGAPEASVSARFRDLRKTKFGAYNVERRYVSNGLFEYRINFSGAP